MKKYTEINIKLFQTELHNIEFDFNKENIPQPYNGYNLNFVEPDTVFIFLTIIILIRK